MFRECVRNLVDQNREPASTGPCYSRSTLLAGEQLRHTNAVICSAMVLVVQFTLFSVQPLCALCLGGSLLLINNNHGDTEHTGCTEKKPTRDFSCKSQP